MLYECSLKDAKRKAILQYQQNLLMADKLIPIHNILHMLLPPMVTDHL